MLKVGVEVQLYSFFNLGARRGGWLTPRLGRFVPGKETRFPFYGRLGGPQGRSGRVQKISPQLGFFCVLFYSVLYFIHTWFFVSVALHFAFLTLFRTHNTNIHAPTGFELAIPASQRPHAYALNRADTGIGFFLFDPRTSSSQLVAIPTALSRPTITRFKNVQFFTELTTATQQSTFPHDFLNFKHVLVFK